jgi:hypothetical protein
MTCCGCPGPAGGCCGWGLVHTTHTHSTHTRPRPRPRPTRPEGQGPRPKRLQEVAGCWPKRQAPSPAANGRQPPSRPTPITPTPTRNKHTQVVLRRPRPRCRRPSVISSAPAPPPQAGSTGVGVVGYWEIHPPPPLPRTSNAVLVVIYALLMHEESSRANSKWDCVSQPTESHRGTRCLPILALPCACGSPVAPASTTPI